MTARPLVARLRRAVTVSPDWRVCARELLWAGPALVGLGLLGGLLSWPPVVDARLLRLAAIALVAPALGEELLFRAALLPTPVAGRPFPLRAAAVSTTLFVLWHPAQALIFGPRWAAVVLDPWFLLATAVLGLTCCRLYWRSGSIWPAVLLHWSAVVAWKAFGGPSPWEGG